MNKIDIVECILSNKFNKDIKLGMFQDLLYNEIESGNSIKINERLLLLIIMKNSVNNESLQTDKLPLKDLANYANISLSTVKRSMKSLQDKGYIIRLKSNKTNEAFKSAYKYMLNFDKFKDKLYLNLKEPKEIETSSSGTKIQISEESISKLFRDFDSDKFYRFYKSNSELMELYKQYGPKVEDF